VRFSIIEAISTGCNRARSIGFSLHAVIDSSESSLPCPRKIKSPITFDIWTNRKLSLKLGAKIPV